MDPKEPSRILWVTQRIQTTACFGVRGQIRADHRIDLLIKLAKHQAIRAVARLRMTSALYAAQTIRNWVRQADRNEERRDDGLTNTELEELRRLREEVLQLRAEREFLKKAAVWFAQEVGTAGGGASRS